MGRTRPKNHGADTPMSRTPSESMTPKSLNWTDAQDLFPGGSLVSGLHDPDGRNRATQIRALIEAMPPKGRFACRSVTVKGERKVEVPFELEEDAAGLEDSLGVRHGERCPAIPGGV
jgi:hypothetical protein